jgi:hypothetical protein
MNLKDGIKIIIVIIQVCVGIFLINSENNNFILLTSGSECKAHYYKLKLQPLQRVRLFPSPSFTLSSAALSEYGWPSCLL